MKILKIALISFLALVAITVIALIIIIKTVDINRFKPQVIEQASKALGRQVDYRDASLGISLFRGLSFRLNNLSVAEDPAFGTGPFLTVKEISVGVDVLGYLLRRQIAITGVIIDTPSVVVIRQKDGSINAQTVAQPAEAAQGGTGAEAPPSSPAVLPALLVSSIKGQNGTVTYIDRSFEPSMRLEVDKLEFTVKDFSPAQSFSFLVKASLLSSQQNISAEGSCKLDPAGPTVTVANLKVDSDLSRLQLARIPDSIPMIPGQALPAELSGEFVISVPEITAGAEGLKSVDATVQLLNAGAKFREMAVPVTGMNATVLISEKDITVNSFDAAIGGGSVKLTGWLKDYLAGQDFSFRFSVDKLNLAEAVAQERYPVQVEGIASADGEIKGRGFTEEAIRTAMVGRAELNVAGPVLKNLNVLRAVLDQISVIPGLGESVQAGLPEKYKQKLNQKDTALNDIKVPVSIANARAFIADTAISAEDFIFRAKGEAGFDGSFAMEGAFLIPAELSGSMVSSVSQLQYLLNEEGMIYIPLKVAGAAGAEMEFKIDSRYMTQKLIENQARQQIMKGLDKWLGGNQTQQPEPPQQGAPGEQGGQEPSGQSQSRNDTQDTVNKLLDRIFK